MTSRTESFLLNRCIFPLMRREISLIKIPTCPRKLLMHKKEILKLYGTLKQEGLTLVPLSLYFKNSRVKVELGLCKGKKLYDKRNDMAKRDAKRTIDRAMKERIR